MFKKLLKSKAVWSGFGMLVTAGALYAAGDIPGAKKAALPVLAALGGLAVVFVRNAILKLDEKVTKQGGQTNDSDNTTDTNAG